MRREAWLSICCGGFVVAQSGLYTNISNQTTAQITAFPAVNSIKMCYITAATVQLLYFAPENSAIDYASTLVSDNYTFTSPSVYVIYSTINAESTLISNDEAVSQVGSVYYNVTRAYLPDTLQTMPAACYHGFGTYKALRVEDLIDPPQNWISDQQCDMVMGHIPDGDYGGRLPNPNGTEQAAFPDLSLPAEMSTYDPAWSGCVQFAVYFPVWDPPRVLQPAVTMVPSTSDLPNIPSLTADPGWRPVNPSPTTPSVTITNTAKPINDPNNPSQTIPGAIAAPVVDQGTIGEPQSIIVKPTMILSPFLPSVGNQGLSQLANGAIAVGDSTIPRGAQVTFSGTPISVGSSFVVVGGTSFGLAMSGSTPSAPVIGGQTIQKAADGGILIGGLTLAQGAQTTISGTPVSVGLSGIILDGTSYQLPTATGNSLLLDGQTIQRAADGGIPIGGLTLAQGFQTTISGTPVSVGSNNVVIGGTNHILPPATGNAVEIDGQLIERLPNGEVVVDGHAMTVNAQSTISGHPISIGTKDIVIAGTTYQLDRLASSTLTNAFGVMIASMFGFVPPSTPLPSVAIHTGTMGGQTPTGNGSTHFQAGKSNSSGSGVTAFVGVSSSLTLDRYILFTPVLCGLALSALS